MNKDDYVRWYLIGMFILQAVAIRILVLRICKIRLIKLN